MQIKELGHVVLYVRDVEQSANFYRDTLGFNELFREGSAAAFSSGRTHHELLLIEVGGNLKTDKQVSPGLYHIYILDPDGNELELYADMSDEWKKNPQAIVSKTKHLHLRS